MTLLKKNNQVEIPSCFFRAGRGTAFVDNAAAGGIFTDYNLEKNKLGEFAYTHVGSGGHSFISHPETGFIFKNQALPYPDKVKELVKKAVLFFPDLPLIGWDIGFSPTGPVLIEGNSNPSLLMMQITLKGLKKNNTYRSILKKH